MIDHDKLRELALKATPGPWHQVDAMVASEPGADFDICDCALGSEPEDKEEWDSALRDARYIAAASPDVVLALLDQLAAMTAARDEACDIADGLYNCDGGDLAPFDRIAALRKVGK
jgi:hypothetical protein